MNNFWNNAAKWGLLIGIIMGSSRILEYGLMLSGEVRNFALLTIEWVVVAVLYVILLYQVAKNRAVQIYDTVGFSFGQSLNYAMIVSMFASVIVAAMTYVYINSVVGGYSIFIRAFTESAIKVLSETGVEGGIMDMYTDTLTRIDSEGVVEPTIFTTLLSTLSTYILAGIAAGAAVSLVVKSKIKKIFNSGQNEQ
ncbi:MAG: DUF4199 family protein [Rikenellaceae bacterium]